MIAMYEPELVAGLPLAQDTLEQRFAAFHREHPEVYAMIEKVIGNSPRWHLSMKAVFEILRHMGNAMPTNSFTPLYADLYVMHHPEQASRFERHRRAPFAMRLVRAGR